MTILNLASEKMFFLWSLIGPFFALATLFLMLLFPTPMTLLFALTIILGLPLCWYEKKWGLIATVFMTMSILFFHSQALNESPIWHIGFAFSLLLTFFINSLSFEEAKALVVEFSGNSDEMQKMQEQIQVEKENEKTKHLVELQKVQLKIESLSQELQVYQEEKNQLHEALDRANHEVLMAREDTLKAKNDFEEIRGELEAKAIKDEIVFEELLEKRKEVFQLREQLHELQSEVKDKSGDIKLIDEVEVQHLQDLLGKKEQELFNVQFRLDSALEDMQKHEQKISQMHKDEVSYKKVQEEIGLQLETLRNERDNLELTVHKLQNQIEQIPTLKQENQKLEESLNLMKNEVENLRIAIQKVEEVEKEKIIELPENDGISTHESRLRRRAEGMYLQLKDQFGEKALVLDETRRQLFRAEESLLQMQRILKEQVEYRLDPQVHHLTQHILKMQENFNREERHYQFEIDELHDLISKITHV